MKKKKVIIILGTTASGKTHLGVKLARKFKGEIISADSRQVYKGMDIGTGKDLEEYEIKTKKGKIKIPYHLIDVVQPKKQFTLAHWLKMASRKIDDILRRKRVPFVVGGTALYLNALIEGYQLPPAKLDKNLRKKLSKLSLETLKKKLKKLDPQTYRTIDKKNRRRLQRALEIILQTKKPLSVQRVKKRPDYHFLILGITHPKNILKKRIEKRLEQRLKRGLIEEVEKLHQQGISWRRLEEFGLEYKFVAQYLQNKISYLEMKEKLKKAIYQFAKRQMTWYKKMKNIHWIEGYSQAKKLVKDFLSN